MKPKPADSASLLLSLAPQQPLPWTIRSKLLTLLSWVAGAQLLSARMTLEPSPTRSDCAARSTFLQPIGIFFRDAFPATSSVPQRPRLECASQDAAHLEVEVGFVNDADTSPAEYQI